MNPLAEEFEKAVAQRREEVRRRLYAFFGTTSITPKSRPSLPRRARAHNDRIFHARLLRALRENDSAWLTKHLRPRGRR